MKIGRIALLVGLGSLAAISSADLLFYGGDANLHDIVIAGRNMAFGGRVDAYDDMHLNSASHITGLFGNFFVDPNASISQAYYEVRQGLSLLSEGIVVASGTVGATATANNLTFGNVVGRTIHLDVSLDLAAGDYYLAISPVGNGHSPRTFIAVTDGVNGVGSPLQNDNSWVHSGTDISYGSNYGDGLFVLARPLTANSVHSDFSYGVEGTAAPVPEPGTIALIGLSAAAAVRRKLRKTAK